MGNATSYWSHSKSQTWVDLSQVLFSTFNFIVVRYLLYLCSAIPKSLNTDRPEKFYWYNVLGSLIHSVISGTWCLACFYANPQMASDLIKGHGPSAQALVAVSTGYFVYDVIDNLSMLPFSKSWEIILHHVVVISCFGISVFRHEFVGYAVVSLLVEVNSVFLHLRQLFRLASVDQGSLIYRLNTIANLATFVVFRICTLLYMTYWLLVEATTVPQPFHGIAFVGMFVMTVMNAVLFVRLLLKDCLGRDRKTENSSNCRVENGTVKKIGEKNGVRKHAKVQ